jgi:uncharacterized repeat protein (TIGR03803 family)
VFEVAHNSGAVTTLATFNYSNGAQPYGGLIEDTSGNLLGTTSNGGPGGYGTVFEVAHNSGTVTTLASFNNTNGANLQGTLVEDSSGNLFGTTSQGGPGGYGTVFEVAHGSGAVTTLASFNYSNGDDPTAGVVEDSSGNLFGTTQGGGTAGGYGTVFEVAHGSGAVTTLATFNNSNGAYPTGSLVQDSSGNLFGTTYQGGPFSAGTVFEVAHGSGAVTTLASFNNSNGADPYGGVVEDGSGNLFGTTFLRGPSGSGTVFEVAHNSGTVTTLASLSYSNGTQSDAGVVEDSSGNLFGTTSSGGLYGAGTVFEVAHNSGAVTTLASFNNSNGADPVGGVVEDSSGNLFGATYQGGQFGYGTVFEVAYNSGTVTTLASFNYYNGDSPQGTLVEDSSGNLFGTTGGGGTAGGYGTVFEVAHGSGAVTTLASFNGSNGSNPRCGVVEDSSGNLFGTTQTGGPGGYGTVFEVAHGSGAVTTLASFNNSNGEGPQGTLVEDSSGNLFGTTYQGGPGGHGTVFEVAYNSGIVTTLASFNGSNGAYPTAGVVEDSSGDLFGTTQSGGPGGSGTVFEVAHNSGAVTTLASFNNSTGAYPEGGLIEDSSGNFFGTTTRGGTSGAGTVFELMIPTPVVTSLSSTSAPESSTITVNGANFTPSSVVQFNGASAPSTTFVSSTQLLATVPEEGSYTLTVSDPVNGTSNGVAFTSTDAPLTAGPLTPPSVAAGQAFSNLTVFHFTDADPSGTAGDYAATVNTGDATLTSAANPGNVQVVASGGGFDVRLSYAYAHALANQTFAVQVTDHAAPASASSSTFGVSPDATATAVSSSSPSSVYGQAVTFTATVANTTSGSSLVPTGSVQFAIDGVAYGSAQPLDGGGHASLTANRLRVSGSPHSIMVSYSNSAGDFSGSSGSLAGGQAVTPAALTVTAAGIDKVYDGTPGATVTLSDNRLAGDVFIDSYSSAAFADKNVGTAKAVTVSGISLSGADAGNYTFNTTASATANITARALTVTASGVDKVYDGTTAAVVTLSDNKVAGDVLTDSYATAAFADKNVGTAKPVGVSGIAIAGADAGNYTFNTTASTTANITARALTVTATGVDKVYDGATAAAVTLADNRLAGDVLTDSYTTASFADKNVGTAKAVSVSGISLSGADAGNYTVNTTASATANITARALAVTASGVNKVYDGTASATVTLADNRVAGDTFTDSYTSAAFADKNAGTGKAVSVTGIAISGAEAGNYTFNTTTSTTATITPAALTVSATGVNKVYDGNTAATVTLADNHLAGDSVTDGYAGAAFADKNVGTAKPVSVSGITLSGADAGNYTFNTTTSTTANITARALTVTAVGVSRVYDGTTVATVTLADNRVAGDVLSDAYTGASFADKNVGTAKPVSVTGISISGTDAGNYSLTATTASATADITPRPLHITATGVNKVYDGTTAATVAPADDRVAGDALTVTETASFADKNVGTNKPVSVTSITVSGADLGNYTFNTTTSTTASITARTLHVTATGVSKVYDGTTVATVTLADDRVAGDVLTVSDTATFADKNVGTNKSVSVTGITVTGADTGNYTFNTTTTTTASITARALTISATGVNKVYDRTTAATVTLADNRVAGDVLTDSYASAAFADRNVGTGKAVSVSGLGFSGADAGNYTLTATTTTTTANITPRALTGSITVSNKVYNGTTAAAIATRTLSGVLAGDTVSYAGGTAAFADKNVGTAKPVTATGLSLSGADAGNYSVNTTATAAADITPRALTVTAAAANKVYDGTTAATVTLADNRVAGDVFTDSYASAAFADKNVGTAKPVSVSGITLSGADAGNYTFNTTATDTANITRRALAVTAAAANKVYDGTTAATVTLADNRIAGDVLTESYTAAAFNNKNAGTGKTVTVSGIALSGTDAGNYTPNATATTTANITKLAITGSITASNKVYDGTTAATIASRTLTGVLGSDVVSYTGGTAAFADKNVGTAKPVTATGLGLAGADAGNYSVNTTATATADITQATLTVTANNASRNYGVANPTFIASYSGFQHGETLGTSGVTGSPSLTTPATPSSPPGTYPINASLGTLAATNYTFAIANGTLTVNPAPLTASGVNFSANAGGPFSGVVARFTNADPFGGVASYTATITWGDGHTSAGTVTDTGGGIYSVIGTNTYADPVNRTVSVLIQHTLGYTTSRTTTCTATVTSLGQGVVHGLSASVSFWGNSTTGQALINSFNGGSTATALANWLATAFPNLYGVGAGANNLTGMTNAQVASFFLTLSGLPAPRVDAEVLATALNVYATTQSLGGTAALSYGFTVNATGLGARSFNVTTNGAAFGVANNTTLNVYELLLAANSQAVNGVLYNGDAVLRQEAFNVFDALNQAGGI